MLVHIYLLCAVGNQICKICLAAELHSENDLDVRPASDTELEHYPDVSDDSSDSAQQSSVGKMR